MSRRDDSPYVKDDAPRTTVRRVRKPSGRKPSITYTAQHYALMRMATEAGISIGGHDGSAYPTVEQLEKFAKFVQLGVEKHEAEKSKVLSPFVSRDELIAAVTAATRKKDVCTPDHSYGSRRGDWSEETIEYVDAELLLHSLNNPESN